jgi:hypothetical protein
MQVDPPYYHVSGSLLSYVLKFPSSFPHPQCPQLPRSAHLEPAELFPLGELVARLLRPADRADQHGYDVSTA